MQLMVKIETEEYLYDSEEERNSHVKMMEQAGWKCTGQIKMDVNQSFYNPEYHWYGKFFRYGEAGEI